jgi:hypothetical protein
MLSIASHSETRNSGFGSLAAVPIDRAIDCNALADIVGNLRGKVER